MGRKRTRRLNRKQLAVIDDLFDGDMDEQEVLAKHNLSWHLYRKWLGDERFKRELDIRIDSARKQSELIIARYAPIAALKLVSLTGSEKAETARKACIDLITMPKGGGQEKNVHDATKETNAAKPLTPAVAGKLLAVLAEEKAADGLNGKKSEKN
jgi:hypothetical protein